MQEKQGLRALQRRRTRRFIWLILMLASMAWYFPINRFAHGGAELLLPVDRVIPLYPPFIIPYLLGTLLFVALPVWAAFSAPRGKFEEYGIALLLATWVSYAVYMLFPTFVSRPEITGGDVFSRAISALYRTDMAYNAIPSGHAFYSTLSFIYLATWKPGYKAVWLAGWLIILASTLFTRQHNLIDIISGLGLAGVAYEIAKVISRKARIITTT